MVRFFSKLLILFACLYPLWGEAATTTVTTAAALQAAINAALPGDTVVIADGTRTNWGTILILHTRDGTPSQPITLKAQTTCGAVFSGQGALNLEVRAANWKIQGLKWQNQTNFGAALSDGAAGGSLVTFDGAQYNVVENNCFSNVAGPGIVIPVMRLRGIRETTGNIFRGNTINGYGQTTGAGAFIKLYGRTLRGFNSLFDIKKNSFKNRTVTSNAAENYWIHVGDGLAEGGSITKTAYVRIQDNLFENDIQSVPRQEAIYVEATGVELSGNTFRTTAGVVFRMGPNHTVARNTFYNPNTSFQNYALRLHDVGHTVVSNLFHTDTNATTALELGMGNTDVGGDGKLDYTAFGSALVANNTLHGFSEASIQGALARTGGSDGVTTVYPHDVDLVNNAIRQDSGTMFVGPPLCAASCIASHNAYYGNANPGCMASGTDNVTEQPDWVSPATGIYTPARSSPLIDAGIELATVVQARVDHDGKFRDTAYDIGAFEYSRNLPILPPAANACATKFGSVSSYLQCKQSDLTCEFSVLLNNSDCSTLCESKGTRCVTSFSNATGSCVRSIEEPCSLSRLDTICVCELNGAASAPPPIVTRYVDSSCESNGNGSSAICGPNGPWTSLKYALETAECEGMSPGSTLIVQGATYYPENGNWYGDAYYPEGDISPDDFCSGIIMENADGDHVVIDGSLDIHSSTWVAKGSGVYECQTGTCGTPTSFPFTAWYNVGAGEQRLDLLQSMQTCTTALPAGKMSYNPTTKKVCAHLSTGASPATAVYFRIPYYAKGFAFEGDNADEIKMRKNLSGAGSFTITRFRDVGISIDSVINQDITVDGLTLSWLLDTGIKAVSTTKTAANFHLMNNTIEYVGLAGIDSRGDIGTASISCNTIRHVATSPVFELCSGVGAGCLPSYGQDPVGIRLSNCAAADALRHASIEHNQLYDFAGGKSGYARGIALEDCTYGAFIDSNFIRDGHTATNNFRAIALTGIPPGSYHDYNIISNNRVTRSDYGLTIDYDTETLQSETCCSDIIGNTFHNNLVTDVKQEDGEQVGGTLNFQDNILSSNSNYHKLIDIPPSSMWAAAFTNNALECSHASCSGQVIATIQGVDYKRNGDCTPGVDCLSVLGQGNIYGDLFVRDETLQVTTSSDALDAGVSLDSLQTDYLGKARPIGPFPDIGAQEFRGVESAPVDITQDGFRFYDRFSRDRAHPLEVENVAPRLHKRSQFNLRFSTFGDSTQTQQFLVSLALYYQRCNPTCGSWLPVTNDCVGTPICIIDNPHRTDGDIIENDLALLGRIYSSSSRYIDGIAATATSQYISDKQVELEFSLAFGRLMALGDEVSIKLHQANGSEIIYYNVPVVKIGPGILKGGEYR